MTDKDLRRLSRADLIEIIYELKKNEVRLTKENEELRQQLENRRILIENAGSIAEAAVKLNDLFAVAQRTADDYLMNIAQLGKSAVQEDE